LGDDIDDGKGLGADEAVGGSALAGAAPDVGRVVGFAAAPPKPSFSRILLKNDIAISF